MSEQQLDIQNHCCAASIPLGFQSSHRLSLLFTQVLVIDFHVWGTRQKRYRVGNELSLINVINVELYNYQRICVCVSQFWVRKFDNQRTTHFGNVFRWVATAKKITPTQALCALCLTPWAESSRPAPPECYRVFRVAGLLWLMTCIICSL